MVFFRDAAQGRLSHELLNEKRTEIFSRGI
jgi:hypothetical protein